MAFFFEHLIGFMAYFYINQQVFKQLLMFSTSIIFQLRPFREIHIKYKTHNKSYSFSYSLEHMRYSFHTAVPSKHWLLILNWLKDINFV